MNRRDARRQRRANAVRDTGSTVEARREAHRRLRAQRGAEAAQYARAADSACLEIHREFPDRAAYRDFLDTLYPAWAADIGEQHWKRRGCFVRFAPDRPPKIREALNTAPRLDLGYFAGQLDADGLWKIDPGDPLPDDEAEYVPPYWTSPPPTARDRYRAMVERGHRQD